MKNVDSSEWQSWHKDKFSKEKISKDYFLMDLLDTYLPKNKLKCIELGCSPGRFLIAIKKRFDYILSGIDMHGFEQTKINLKYNGIKLNEIKLIKEDMFDYEPKEKFDIVCSFGLIEHFKDYRKAFLHMNKFLKKGGYMIIGVPRFRGVYKLVHFFLGSGIYHNYSIMEKKELIRITVGYKKLFCGYYPKLPGYKSFLFKILFKINPPFLVYIGIKNN